MIKRQKQGTYSLWWSPAHAIGTLIAMQQTRKIINIKGKLPIIAMMNAVKNVSVIRSVNHKPQERNDESAS